MASISTTMAPEVRCERERIIASPVRSSPNSGARLFEGGRTVYRVQSLSVKRNEARTNRCDVPSPDSPAVSVSRGGWALGGVEERASGAGQTGVMDEHSMRKRTLTVDGESFEVTDRPGEPGTYDFVWLSGPDPGHGFTSAVHPATALSVAELEESVRDFLGQVDPVTGHIE